MTLDPTTRILNFKTNKAENLTLEELRLTVDERSSGGKPVNGIRHVELLDSIIDRLVKRGIQFSIDTIFATEGGSGIMNGATYIQDLAEKYGAMNIRTYILRRIIAMIKFHDGDSDHSFGGVAMSYHQQGIMMAYGQSVYVCKNLSIMGTNNVMTTFGDQYSKLSNIAHMIDVVENWAVNHMDKRMQDLRTMDRMREIEMPPKAVEEFIGHLNVMRIQKDIYHTIKEYPLNQTQISQFTENYIREANKNPEDVMSLYDIYNIGTDFHKAGKTDLPLIIPNNVTFFEALNEKYKLVS